MDYSLTADHDSGSVDAALDLMSTVLARHPPEPTGRIALCKNVRDFLDGFVARKLMLLDYVLSHSQITWYAAERDKVELLTGLVAAQADLWNSNSQ